MVTEERDKTNCKHDGNEEQKKNVEATNPFQVTLPKTYKI
jgi:hypothetical protein